MFARGRKITIDVCVFFFFFFFFHVENLYGHKTERVHLSAADGKDAQESRRGQVNRFPHRLKTLRIKETADDDLRKTTGSRSTWRRREGDK